MPSPPLRSLCLPLLTDLVARRRRPFSLSPSEPTCLPLPAQLMLPSCRSSPSLPTQALLSLPMRTSPSSPFLFAAFSLELLCCHAAASACVLHPSLHHRRPKIPAATSPSIAIFILRVLSQHHRSLLPSHHATTSLHSPCPLSAILFTISPTRVAP